MNKLSEKEYKRIMAYRIMKTIEIHIISKEIKPSPLRWMFRKKDGMIDLREYKVPIPVGYTELTLPPDHLKKICGFFNEYREKATQSIYKFINL